MPEITREVLRDYLNDALPDAELTAVEKAVREQPAVQALLHQIRQEVDRGEHSVGAVWRRERVEYDGKHYTVRPTEFPTIGDIVQQPRVPIWCVGALDHPKSMRRALRWDGLLPQVGGNSHPSLKQVEAIRNEIGDRPYDIVIEGQGSEHSPAAWASAGATWWIESMWSAVNETDAALAANDRLLQGPPR